MDHNKIRTEYFCFSQEKQTRDLLVKLDEIIKSINNGGDYVLVFTNEPYVNTNHGVTKKYLPKEQNQNCKLKRK